MWISDLLIAFLRLVIGASARWESQPDFSRQRIYIANHTSHIDTLAIMSALPREARIKTKPIAAADYWGKNRFLSWVSQKGLNAVLIDRKGKSREEALAPVVEALNAGHSVIFFPEGTRSQSSMPGEFKSGLHSLYSQFPDVEMVPIYLENLHRAMPKGKRVLLPILCTIRIGNPIVRKEGEQRVPFLMRAHEAVVELSK